MHSCAEMGRELRRIRLSAKLSQAALADLVGVARSTVSRMETGARTDMSMDTVIKVAAACGFTIRFTIDTTAQPTHKSDGSAWLYSTRREG